MTLRRMCSLLCALAFVLACGSSSGGPIATPSATPAVADGATSQSANSANSSRLDLTGQWTGTVSAVAVQPGAGPTLLSPGLQSFDIKQQGEEIRIHGITANGWSSECWGLMKGSTAWLKCSLANYFDHSCYANDWPAVIAVDTAASPIGFTISFSWIGQGSSCDIEGWQILGYAGTFTKQSGPILDVAGNWSGTATVNGSVSTLTYTATQTGSRVTQVVIQPGGIAYTCLGPIVGDVIYTYCGGVFPPISATCTGTGSVTQTVNPNATPLTETVVFNWTLGNDCGSASGGTFAGTGADTRSK